MEASLAAQREGSDRDYLQGARDIHEADIAFQKTVRDMYRKEAARDPRFIRIDCADERGAMLPPEAIFARIRAVVDAFMNRAQ